MLLEYMYSNNSIIESDNHDLLSFLPEGREKRDRLAVTVARVTSNLDLCSRVCTSLSAASSKQPISLLSGNSQKISTSGDAPMTIINFSSNFAKVNLPPETCAL